MKLFNTLALEISSRCNRKCSFCPVAYNVRPDEVMDLRLFQKAMSELGQLQYRGRVELYIYNEPLKDKEQFGVYLTTARELCPKCCLMIATNGDYIRSSQEIVQWFEMGLNQLLINCYGPGLYQKRQRWLSEMPPDVTCGGGVYNQARPHSRALQMLDKSNNSEFGTGVFALVNRAGNIPEFMPELAAPVERMCTKPFRMLNIDWKGRALVCCQDYHAEVSYGSLVQETLVNLWTHPVMNEYRRRLKKKDRSLPLCRKCDCHAGAYPHNTPKPEGPYASFSEVESLWQRNKNPQREAGDEGEE